MTQRGPYTEGTFAQLKSGGPLMVVEDIRTDGIVATVWFEGAICHRDGFHPASLTILQVHPPFLVPAGSVLHGT